MTEVDLKDHVVLVGSGRTGKGLAKYLNKRDDPLVVIDFNPRVFARLTAEKTPILFGDLNDPEILDLARIDKAKLVISTTSTLSDNLPLLEHIRRLKHKPLTMFTALDRQEGIKYYEKGATYVVVPQQVAGEHIRQLIKTYGVANKKLRRMGRAQFNRLLYN